MTFRYDRNLQITSFTKIPKRDPLSIFLNFLAIRIGCKARVRARGQVGSGFYGEKRVAYLRRKCRTQNLWLLQLSGDFHEARRAPLRTKWAELAR